MTTSENVTVYLQILWYVAKGRRHSRHFEVHGESPQNRSELDDDVVIPSHLSNPSSYVTLAPNALSWNRSE